MQRRRRAAARSRLLICTASLLAAFGWVTWRAAAGIGKAADVHPPLRRHSEQGPPSDHADSSPPLVAIADLHGDLQQAGRVLQLAQLADGRLAWTGGNATLVQLGDMLDRGPDSLGVVRLFERLRAEAAAAGGRVVTLLGNHERMNLEGQHAYVSPEELRNLAAGAGAEAGAGPRLWREALSQDAEVGAALRRRPVLALEGAGACRTLFVHAGVPPGLLTAEELRHPSEPLTPEQLVAALNARTQGVLRCSGGACAQPQPTAAALLDGPDSLVWTRQYVRQPEARFCSGLAAVLQRFGAAQLVVGHSVMWEGAQARCGRRLFMLDVGMSSAIAGRLAAWRCRGGRTEVLQPG